jgi:hypothetical protein
MRITQIGVYNPEPSVYKLSTSRTKLVPKKTDHEAAHVLWSGGAYYLCIVVC